MRALQISQCGVLWERHSGSAFVAHTTNYKLMLASLVGQPALLLWKDKKKKDKSTKICVIRGLSSLIGLPAYGSGVRVATTRRILMYHSDSVRKRSDGLNSGPIWTLRTCRSTAYV